MQLFRRDYRASTEDEESVRAKGQWSDIRHVTCTLFCCALVESALITFLSRSAGVLAEEAAQY